MNHKPQMTLKMNKTLKNLKNIFIFSLIILGIVMISWIIWSRFIRERLPKNIPFDLTEKRFYTLTYICCIYLFVIYSLLKPKKQNIILKKLIDIIYLPIISVDNLIKNNDYVLFKYINFIEKKLHPKLLTVFMHRIKNLQAIYIFFNIIPRIILISILLIDIFYYQKIDNFYNYILLGILPLLHRYIKYSYKNIKEQYICYLENMSDSVYLFIANETLEENYEKNPEKYPEIKYHEKKVTIREYFEKILVDENTIEYDARPQFLESFIKAYNLVYPQNKENFKEKLLDKFDITILSYESVISYYPVYSKAIDSSFIKWVRILIFSLYFICWFYILCVSFHTIKDMKITITILTWLIENFKDTTEPFSNLMLNMFNNE